MHTRASLQLGIVLLGAVAAQAQGTPTYTLNVEAHAVVTDVLVLDRKGNPVIGLPASAFHLSDNGTPQRIAASHEHCADGGNGQRSRIPAVTRTYTNDTSHL